MKDDQFRDEGGPINGCGQYYVKDKVGGSHLMEQFKDEFGRIPLFEPIQRKRCPRSDLT